MLSIWSILYKEAQLNHDLSHQMKKNQLFFRARAYLTVLSERIIAINERIIVILSDKE